MVRTLEDDHCYAFSAATLTRAAAVARATDVLMSLASGTAEAEAPPTRPPMDDDDDDEPLLLQPPAKQPCVSRSDLNDSSDEEW